MTHLTAVRRRIAIRRRHRSQGTAVPSAVPVQVQCNRRRRVRSRRRVFRVVVE